jgi:TolB-like protein
MSFWGELKRRNVVKAGIAYLVVAWLLAQVVQLVLPTFNAPEWTVQTIIFLLILGFPVVLIIAWAFEITPEGVKLTANLPRSESTTSVTGQRLNYLVTVLLVLAVVFMAIDRYVLEGGRAPSADSRAAVPSPDATNEISAPAGAVDLDANVLPNSVAVLPFTNLSSNPEDAFFAAAIHEEILNQLAKLSSLRVIARTSVMQYVDTTKTIPEIARELNVEAVMEGSVRYAGNSILVTAQLIDPKTGLHLWSETYPGDRSDVSTQFAMQADIAMNIANALEAEFSPAEQERIELLPTKSSEAYDLYLAARSLNVPASLDDALLAIDNALRIDPNFADAWALKSALHSSRTIVVPGDQIAKELQASIDAAARALDIDPANTYARINQADGLATTGNWIGARRILDSIDRAALLRAANVRLFIFYANIGDYDAAFQAISAARDIDPLNADVRAHYLEAYGLRGDLEGVAREYKKGVELFGERWYGAFWWTMFNLDPANRSADVAVPPYNEIWATLGVLKDRPREGLDVLRRTYAEKDDLTVGDKIRIVVWAAYFGDTDFSLDVMQTLLERGGVTWSYYLFYPMTKELRRTPRFKSILRDSGLVAYWSQYGWPAFCRPTGANDFECD